MEKVTVDASIFAKMLSKLGIKKPEDLKDMVITAADGTEISIDRNEGDPQVGDKAMPDGQFVLADGSVMTIADGAITSIEAPVDEKDAKIADLQSQVDTLTADKSALAEQVKGFEGFVKPEDHQASLDKVADLEKQVADLNAEKQTLSEQVTNLTADAKTDDEKALLAKVGEIAGEMNAMEWLDLASKASSQFVSNKAAFNEGHNNDPKGEPVGAEFLAAKRAQRQKAIAI